MTSNRKGKCLGVNRIYATGASGGDNFCTFAIYSNYYYCLM